MSKDLVSDLTIVGQLLDFVIKDGYKVKYLRITVSDREYWIKLPKEIRKTLNPSIKPGCWLEISGTQKLKRKTGTLKLKAEDVQLIPAPNQQNSTATIPQAKPKKAKILVCGKSSCRKRGVKAVCEALESSLQACGLGDEIKIKETGCLKQCKKGPNIIMMPDKARYTQVRPQEIPTLIGKHYTKALYQKDNS